MALSPSRIKIDQDGQRIEATLETGEPLTLVVRGEPHELCRDQVLRVLSAPKGCEDRNPV